MSLNKETKVNKNSSFINIADYIINSYYYIYVYVYSDLLLTSRIRRSIFKCSLKGLISDFYFSYIGGHTKITEPKSPTINPRLEGGMLDSYFFQSMKHRQLRLEFELRT